MSALELPTQALWLPGKGLVPAEVRQAIQAVKEYEPDLTLGRHEQTGEWVVLAERGPEGRPFPVFGLGPDLPAPEAIKQKLHANDVRRNGKRVMERLERHYEVERRHAKAERDAQTEVAADALLWAARKEGKATIPRIFVPGSKEAK